MLIIAFLLQAAAAPPPDIELNARATVRRVTDRSGQLLEVITDTANRVVSSRRVSGAQSQPRQ